MSIVALTDPNSKGAEYVGLVWQAEIFEKWRDVPFGDVAGSVVPDALLHGVFHCVIVNLFPCRVEKTFKILSGGRVSILQEQFYRRGKLAVK